MHGRLFRIIIIYSITKIGLDNAAGMWYCQCKEVITWTFYLSETGSKEKG